MGEATVHDKWFGLDRGIAKPLLRGPRAHSVEWLLHDDHIEGTVTCHASEGADCRMVCPEGCESWGVNHVHPLIDQGKCNFIEWMEATDGVLDAHVGSHEPTDGFIEPEFDDDHYTWTYSVLAPTDQGGSDA